MQAPPGAGKTTRIPLAVLEAERLGAAWLDGRGIIMLEPRRIAARAAATYMSELLGESVGGTVGYRMRMERRVSARTRIEVLTEGMLTRQIQHDPALERAAIVLFDEFHERSLDADLALALTLHSQSLVRPDLRVVAMSATLDGVAVARILGDGDAPAPIIASEGRSYPIEIRYAPPRAEQRLEASTARAVKTAIAEHEGDVLVFLPGAAEIRRTASALSGGLPPGVDVVPLYGMLDQATQAHAIRPSPPGRRKVVLATSIAETSLTIEGVRVVIDAGLSRRPRFSPRTGMTRLETSRVSRAAADQRCGRAGRLAPGICYRMWAEHDQHQLLPQAPPEIINADLAPLALELACAGIDDVAELNWVDVPPASALAQARELLRTLGALDEADRATPDGRAIAKLPLHPRLGTMLSRAGASVERAAAIAALLGDRDPFRSIGGSIDADLAWRVDALLRGGDANADREALRRARAEQRRLAEMISGSPRSASATMSTGALLALAYPDRVARRRGARGASYLLRNGRGAALDSASSLASAEFLAIAEIEDRGADGRILLAAALSEAESRELFARQITESVDESAVRAAALTALKRRGLASLPWTDAARSLRARIAFAASLPGAGNWPDVTDEGLASDAVTWLEPFVKVSGGRVQLDRVDLVAALRSLMSWAQRQRLDDVAPETIEVPTGSRIAVDYSDPRAPALAVRIQELFGLAETPRVGAGRVPVTLQLLSPSRRPVQVTRDLAGFWRSSYFDVRKDLRGRYPKHDWPEDPLRAPPSRGAKRRPR